MSELPVWRYEIRGSSLYDLDEDRPVSLAEAGEILNAHQRLLITSGVWAGKAGLAEARATAAEAERDDYRGRNEAEYYHNEDLSRLLSETARLGRDEAEMWRAKANVIAAKLAAAEERLQVAVAGLRSILPIARAGLVGLQLIGNQQVYADVENAAKALAALDAARDSSTEIRQ